MAACSNPCSCCSSCSSLRCRSSCLRSRSAAFSCRRSYMTHSALTHPIIHSDIVCESIHPWMHRRNDSVSVSLIMHEAHSSILFMYITVFFLFARVMAQLQATYLSSFVLSACLRSVTVVDLLFQLNSIEPWQSRGEAQTRRRSSFQLSTRNASQSCVYSPHNCKP